MVDNSWLCKNHQTDALGGSAHALPPPLKQLPHCDSHSEGFFCGRSRKKEDSSIAMRHEPPLGAGMAQGGRSFGENEISPEPFAVNYLGGSNEAITNFYCTGGSGGRTPHAASPSGGERGSPPRKSEKFEAADRVLPCSN